LELIRAVEEKTHERQSRRGPDEKSSGLIRDGTVLGNTLEPTSLRKDRRFRKKVLDRRGAD